ncbi:chemotaxis protein CheA [Paenibacillus contaminans]|uniref:Chemotaxis protein CheA n=1 Tax=Paenibacillus contaminans TaxID=450362 RepID=A0A329MTK4_9BACL|nr:chemotaxis protein CheA [Paenibacillus contaminans]RAV22726.1 chemotaxis protein CheA [Paenibacillus contaminans]
MELNQYLSMFIDESKDHLQAMNENLLALEQQPNEISIVHNIFRSAHTLKGMSATMGYEDLASLTHQMENVLDLVRNLKLGMNAYIFDVLFKSLDALESMVNDIIDGGTGRLDVSHIVTMLKSIESGDYGGQAQSKAAGAASGGQSDVDEFQYSIMEQSIEAGMSVFYIEVTVREDCVLKAARAYMVFTQLEQNGEVIKAIPGVEDIEQEKFDKMFAVYYVSGIEQAQLEKLIGDVSEIESVNVVPITLDNLRQIARGGQQKTAQADNLPMENKQAAADKPAGEKAPAPVQGGGGQASRTIRVDIERLDTLMNLFSELLIDRVRLEQLAGEVRRNDLIETVEHMARVSSDLQNIVLKLRMVPVETVFNRFPRMIRDIAKSLDKKVDLVITGAETELDRTVIDEIGDPLVHLLRNAIDHGVESVQERLDTGKNDTGTIQLKAFHSGNHVFIEIEDDGKGIHREKVLKTALKNGVVTQEQAAKMSDQEVYQLLFASGFSTADKISDISGRGVGLDVVKTKIQTLGGHVHVDSKLGSGTKFSVQLPLTLSIIAAMLIRIGNEKYALPLSSIVETMAMPAEKVRLVHGNRLIDYRKSVIPIVSLSSVFQVPGCDSDSKELHLVVVRKGDKIAALQVDDFIGQQEIVLKSLGKYLTNIFAISGATILGDGQVALIIDPNALIK